MPILAATKESIDRAAEALAKGEIVAFPTETVYGLGANALNAAAVAKVFAAKDRPRFNPLIVHVLGEEEAETCAVVNNTARRLMRAFWPGPLSLVLLRKSGTEPLVRVMVEGEDETQVRAYAEELAKLVTEVCA